MKSNVVKMRCKRGFTLIELLVVVLIIGILAAVALPQYNKAVKKSQGAEVLVAIDALDKALTSYYLEHSTYDGVGIDSLNIDIPELHHFKYSTNSSDDSYAKGDFSFNNNSVRSYGPAHKALYLWSPEGLRIEVAWEYGALVHKHCFLPPYGVGDTRRECGDYFKCTWISPYSGDTHVCSF